MTAQTIPNDQTGAAPYGLRRIAVATLVLVLLAGCVHRIDIQQGNFLDTEDIDRIAVGMTRVQVRALLGTPMVADPFQGSRWDYVYYLKKGRWRKPEQRHFVVYFDGTDKVAKIERPSQPPKT
jgi:outer membrane protein assembly factor BamE